MVFKNKNQGGRQKLINVSIRPCSGKSGSKCDIQPHPPHLACQDGDAPCISRLASASAAAFAGTAAPVATELSQCLWALAVSNGHTLATEQLLEMAKACSDGFKTCRN